MAVASGAYKKALEGDQTPKQVLVKIDRVTKKFDETIAVDDVSLEIKKGEIFALLGGSGSGKSTVMNCLNGMDLEGVKGTVVFRNVDLMLMNDEEAQFWAQTDDSLEAGEKLLAAGPRYAIVKHGSAGSTLFHRTPEGEIRLFRCPAWPLKHAQDPSIQTLGQV